MRQFYLQRLMLLVGLIAIVASGVKAQPWNVHCLPVNKFKRDANKKMKRVAKKITLFFYFMVFLINLVKGQPWSVLKGSHPDFFTYFTPGSPAMPPNTPIASKALLLLQRRNLFNNDNPVSSSSAFLIRTFRDDNRICACMSAHQLGLPYSNISIVKPLWQLSRSVYMNYLGADSISNGIHYNKMISADGSYLPSVSVRAYFYDPTMNRDIALVWIDKNLLPSASYSMLGYDFSKTGWTDGRNYAMGHPLGYPQRVSDSLELSESGVDGNTVDLVTELPYAVGPGVSGSPVIQTLPGELNDWYVKGVVTHTYTNREIDVDLDERIAWATDVVVNNIGQLENAIRLNCWKKEDSLEIATSQRYKQSVIVDNTSGIAPYSQNQSLTTAAAVTASPGVTSQTEGVKETVYKANICGISGFTLPTAYPGISDPWAVTFAAKEINVASGFIYAASGLSELNLASVVIGTAAYTTARQSGNAQPGSAITKADSGLFHVYPNPSPDGTFNISLPATGSFRLAIHNLEGKCICEASCSSNPFQFKLPAVSRGTYLLTVFNTRQNESVCQKLIVY